MLRIPVSHFVKNDATKYTVRSLPPRLVHLVTFETPNVPECGILVAQDCVMELIERKRNGNGELGCTNLETVRVNGKVSKVAKER